MIPPIAARRTAAEATIVAVVRVQVGADRVAGASLTIQVV
jgi:hypothetical protein